MIHSSSLFVHKDIKSNGK